MKRECMIGCVVCSYLRWAEVLFHTFLRVSLSISLRCATLLLRSIRSPQHFITMLKQGGRLTTPLLYAASKLLPARFASSLVGKDISAGYVLSPIYPLFPLNRQYIQYNHQNTTLYHNSYIILLHTK
jgi:hypothetical protein